MEEISSSNKPTEKTKLIRGGREYFDLLMQLIYDSVESIHLQTYIFDDDESGIKVADALKAASRRGVSVYLLADGYASQVMSQSFINELREAGIHFRFFEPLLKCKYFYFGRRMHHKIFVADAKFSLVGGINIANHYNDIPGKAAWLDFALYAEGEISRELCVLCWKTWNGFPTKMELTPCETKKNSLNGFSQKTDKIKIRRNDWVRSKNEISESYFTLFQNAKSNITVLSSYFLPGKKIRKVLSKAASRGVKIKVITAGPSDVMLAKYAERWLYDWLLRNKIELYEFQPVVLHAKVALCDNEWFTIGSYNVNNISAYASIELNLDVHDPVLTTEVGQLIAAIIHDDCILITSAKHSSSKNIFRQFIRWCSYQLIRTIFYLLTFYYRQRI